MDLTTLTDAELNAREENIYRLAMIIADQLDALTPRDPSWTAKTAAFGRHRRNHQAVLAEIRARRAAKAASGE